jgi:hypothetical protein
MNATTTATDERQVQSDVDVIMTVGGGEDTAYSILRGGGMVGMESDTPRPPANIPIEFVDWPFLKDDDTDFDELWDRHSGLVREERPEYAVAPDVDGRPLPGVLDRARSLNEYATTVIVVPKDVHPTRIPPEYRVGIPCQDRFGPSPWKWTEYQECGGVHLLGGSPSKQQGVAKHYVTVESLDTASIIKAARFGKVWSDEKWRNQDNGFYPAIEASVGNILGSWNGYSSGKSPYPRPMTGRSGVGYPDGDLVHPDEQLPFPGREWKIERA